MIPTLNLGGLGRGGRVINSAFALVAHAKAVSATSGIDTSGSNLIVLIAVGDSNPTVSDNKSNTWTGLPAGGGTGKIWYCVNPTVGSGHTFTISLSTGAIFAMAFSGSGTPYPLDSQLGSSVTGTSLQPGNIVPANGGELFVSGLALGGNSGSAAIDSGFTLADSINGISGTSYGGGSAYLIQNIAAAKNPTWSWTTSNLQYARSAAFFSSASPRLDANWSLKQLILFNDNKANASTSFADQSYAGRTTTVGGNAQYSTGWAATGMTSSALFDGTGDYVYVADDPTLEPLALDWALEFGFTVPNTTGNHVMVAKGRTSNGYSPIEVDLIGNSLQFSATSTGSSWDVASGQVIGTVSANTEYRVVVSRVGTSFQGYLNETRGFQFTSSATLFDGDGQFRVGTDKSGNSGFNGNMSPLRYTVKDGLGYTGTTCATLTFPFPTHG